MIKETVINEVKQSRNGRETIDPSKDKVKG
jgi:hypothetical protein